MEPIDAAHLLRRAGFGGTSADIELLTPLSRAEAVERLLDVSAATPVGPAPPRTNDDLKYEQFVNLWNDWYQRMATTPAPLVEKMSLFWHNHFTTSLEKTYDPPFIHAQHELYWTNALGNFRTFAQAMAIEPAMLDYLDNRWSNKYGPNQNFARELMELFVLGVGNYSEDDVQAAAQAWTGHSINDEETAYLFRADWHDDSDKTFFGETKNWDGPDIIDKIFDSKPEVVAAFVTRKLWSFFAFPNPPRAIVDELSSTFRSNDWSIAAVVRTILNHDQFYSDAAKQGLVRTPAEYLAVAIRGLGGNAAALRPEWYQDALGQTLYNPPDVSGWKQNRYWISSATAGGKAEFARSAHWLLEQAGIANPVAQFKDLEPAEAVAKTLALFSVDIRSDAHRTAMVDWLTEVKSLPDEEWTIVPFLTTLALMLPELQLA
jgi:uncharacterized protein (DUF1800 family)